MNDMEPIAHIAEDGRVHLLEEHLRGTVYRHLFGNIPREVRRHRALDDARLTVQIWLALDENP